MNRDYAICILELLAHTEAKWPGTEETLKALDMAIKSLRSASLNEPLIQSDLDKMDYEKIWIDYGSGNGGEWALVNNGRIYLLSNLEGCAFDDILQSEAPWETLDRPTGDYTAYRCPPENWEGGDT